MIRFLVIFIISSFCGIAQQKFTFSDVYFLSAAEAQSRGGTTPSPAFPTNATFYYTADSLSGSDGDKVASWTDDTGNGFPLYAFKGDSANYSPYFTNNAVNSKPAVVWMPVAGSVTNAMTNSFSGTRNQPWTLFLVGKLPYTINLIRLDGIDGSNRLVFRSNSSSRLGIASTTSYYGGSPGPEGAYCVYTLCFNGASSYIRTNGVLYLAPGTNIGSQGVNGFTFGAVFNGSLGGTMLVPAIIGYNGTMATNDMQWVENTLKTEYGL